ncbi:peptide-methionine (R)-S-oxide reductase MsrB [Roseiconus lacunae]|uniref:peptide-methionine (R)-S-oxide reductase MsrB n=1 Tax=Roseiconus lacunae TaxID=2605694 RepID=UPI002AA4F776
MMPIVSKFRKRRIRLAAFLSVCGAAIVIGQAGDIRRVFGQEGKTANSETARDPADQNRSASQDKTRAPENSRASADPVADQDPDETKIKEPEFRRKSKSQLKRALTSIEFKVTQNADTEPAFRNRYWNNKKDGLYRCVVCGLSLFSSETKYKSGTGWPSFWAPIEEDHVGYKTDYFLFYPRTEVHCKRCSAHLGHVFDDGPTDTTGKRFCMNSAAMKFYESGKENDFDE